MSRPLTSGEIATAKRTALRQLWSFPVLSAVFMGILVLVEALESTRPHDWPFLLFFSALPTVAYGLLFRMDRRVRADLIDGMAETIEGVVEDCERRKAPFLWV